MLAGGALAAGSPACGGSGREGRPAPDPPSAAAAMRTAKSYVAAYNAGDGQRVCRLLDPAIRVAAVRSADATARACAPFLTREIGSYRIGDDEYGEWRGARIVRAGAVEVNGRRAVVGLRLRHRIEGGLSPGPLTDSDALQLVARDGRWLLSKPGRILYRALGVADISHPATVLDPPGDAGSLDRPASLPRPRFTCTGRSLRVPDPPGDVATVDTERRVAAPALDVRAVTVRQARSGTVCVTIDLARTPRPDTLVRFYWDTPGAVPAGVRSVRIDGLGRAHDRDSVEFRRRVLERGGSRWGAVGRSLSMQIPFRDGRGPLPGRRFEFSVSVESLQREELWLADPLEGEDTVPADASGGGGAVISFPPR